MPYLFEFRKSETVLHLTRTAKDAKVINIVTSEMVIPYVKSLKFCFKNTLHNREKTNKNPICL